MQAHRSWEEMLASFRALGGTAENIRIEAGELSARDPGLPVLLRVPEKLLFPPTAFEFAGGFLRLKDIADASPAVRDFLDHYEQLFGPKILLESEAAITSLDSLPLQARDLLIAEFEMQASFEGNRARRLERRFVDRRIFRVGEQEIVSPVLELATHDPSGLVIQIENGIRIAGPAREGVRIFHPFHDALAIFERFGFAAAQPAAFSLPMRFVSEGLAFAIGRKLHVGERRGDLTVPQINVVARDSVELSHVMIGHAASPRLARGIFCTRMREADVKDPDWHFDRLAQENAARFMKLLDTLESETGPTVLPLKKMARHQLEAMSWSIGTCEV